ncbi:MAG: sulfatase-like hydrolase/transferase, partial [Verrucomicrobiota bacterium]
MSRAPLLLLSLFCSLTLGAADRPNIVFILADDLGYAEVGFNGQKKILTPHLDRLAKEGVVLSRHYSGNAVCAPSRSVLMTGFSPGHAHAR